MGRLKPILPIKLDDTNAERVRVQHEQAITDLQKAPASSLKTVAGVSLANGAATPVPHTLGHAPSWVGISVPRGATSAGYIVETITSARASVLTLTANGYGATITVDVVLL